MSIETDELKKYRQFWWKTGNIHPKAKREKAIQENLRDDKT
ncbi:12557_t:CDS:2, partial [Acaulospora morrowiae]